MNPVGLARMSTAIVAVTAMLTACAPAESAPQHVDTPSGSATDAANPVSINDLPLAWYLVTASEQRKALSDARNRILETCMEAKGFAWRPVPYAPDPDFLSRRYGLLDIDWARSNGHRPSDYQDPPPSMEGENIPSDPAQQKAYLLALNGDASDAETIHLENPVDGSEFGTQTLTGGCTGEANEQIFGSMSGFVEYTSDDLSVQLLAQEALSRALADQAVLEAEADWSTCMQNRGYEFGAVSDIFAYMENQGLGANDSISDEETALAVADVECRVKAKYAERAAEAEVRTQLELLEATQLDVERIASERERVLASAVEIADG